MIKLQIESQEHERKRIGADLHDSLGSLFWGIKVNVSFIQRSVDMNSAAVSNSYQELTHLLEEGIETVRRIAWELTPEEFHYSGLSASVTKLCERLGGKGIDIHFNEENIYFWNDERALQVFRIIQELVSNTFKHSGATLLTVSMKWMEQQLEVTVSDNGSGFKPNHNTNGIGLWNINQRTKQLNGKIHIGDAPIDTGAEIFLEIPLTP
jgi:signal transduction histidine kinase